MDAKKLIFAGKICGPVRVDNWPDQERVYKTIAIHADSYVGALLIEASLMTNPTSGDWFSYYTQYYTSRPDQRSDQFRNDLITNRDRVIWLRATMRPGVISGPVISSYQGYGNTWGRGWGSAPKTILAPYIFGRMDRVLVM